jgi:chromosomal replication initiator protein
MEKLFVFIKDNIQDQAYKTWFEPIKSVELTDNALYIQVPSKFFSTNG